MPIYLKIMQVAAVTHFSYSLFLLFLDKHSIILYKYYIFQSSNPSFLLPGDGKCVICDSYVRPCTLVRICDECNYGSYQGRCVICGGPGVSDAYYCKECTIQEKDVSVTLHFFLFCICHGAK